MPARFLFFTVISVCLTSACSQPGLLPFDPAATNETSGDALLLQRLQEAPVSFSYYGGLAEPARILVDNTEQWQHLWAQLWELTSPVPPLPEIDFEQEVLIVAALGSRPSGGFSIFVDSAYHQADHISVVIRSVSPHRCVVTAALTAPVDIARLPRTGVPLRFVERREVHVCE